MWTYLINCFSRFSHTSGIFSPMYFWIKVTATRSSLSLARPCLRDCENKARLPPLPARHQSGAFCTLTKQHTHTHTSSSSQDTHTHTHTPFIPITIKTHPTYSLTILPTPSLFCRFIHLWFLMMMILRWWSGVEWRLGWVGGSEMTMQMMIVWKHLHVQCRSWQNGNCGSEGIVASVPLQGCVTCWPKAQKVKQSKCIYWKHCAFFTKQWTYKQTNGALQGYIYIYRL